MSLAKSFFILLFILHIGNIYPAIAGNYNSVRYEVHIVSALPNDDISLWYHCASKDDEFGTHMLKVGEEFHFRFIQNLWESTLFFCHFWWGEKQNAFDVFSNSLTKLCSKSSLRTCYWKVQSDGFYAGPKLDQLNLMHGW
ncbi:putative DNA-directed RNA polymerases II and IV subunit 5A-like [Capsicum annuum]|nr:putative DNA-directed RNA polymerases II and IV subunit 5A-like [Capsicum annuum]